MEASVYLVIKVKWWCMYMDIDDACYDDACDMDIFWYLTILTIDNYNH